MSTRTLVKSQHSTPSSNNKISVRLKSQPQSRRPRAPRKKWLFSWNGLEDKKAQLQQTAHEIIALSEAISPLCEANNWSLAGIVANGVRDPSLVASCK